MNNMRYDRQVRLWGASGQSALESAKICILGADALATELAKSLVLGGVGTIVLFDDAVITKREFDRNFFVSEDAIGKNLAEETAINLQEMNPDVQVIGKDCDPTKLASVDLLAYGPLTAVVSTRLREDQALSLSDELFSTNVPFFFCRNRGLIGMIRLCVPEHCVFCAKPDNPRPDLRLDKPFQKLADLFAETQIATLPPQEVRRLPYIYLLLEALNKFKSEHPDVDFPTTIHHRRRVVKILDEMFAELSQNSSHFENFAEAKAAVNKVLFKTEVPEKMRRIFDSPKCAANSECVEPFWIMMTALKMFVERHGVLPLCKSLPDMASATSSYTKVVSAFREEASNNTDEVLALCREVEQTRLAETVISVEMCQEMCTNARFVDVQFGTPLRADCEANWNSAVDKLNAAITDDDSVPVLCWYFALRAADLFESRHSRAPGNTDDMVSADESVLKSTLNDLLQGSTSVQTPDVVRRFPTKVLDEMARFGDATPHPTSAMLGAVIAQEVIKIITGQYLPIENLVVFDFITFSSETFKFGV